MSEIVPEPGLEEVPILPGDVPVTMPELPLNLVCNTVEQFKASNDPVRQRILGILRSQPATAKQLATALNATPGAIGHHIKVLEEAGLIKLVARRITRGIIAKYYTRSARIFLYELPKELKGTTSIELDILNLVRNELVEALDTNPKLADYKAGFPHARLTPERVTYYQNRLDELVNEFLSEREETNAPVYGFGFALFRSPEYMQKLPDEK